MTFDWDHWDKVASVVTGLITVAGLAWAFFKRLWPRIPVEASDRERWYKHLDAVADQARIEPSEGLEAGVTNAILAKTYVQLAVTLTKPEEVKSNPVPLATEDAIGVDIWELLRSRTEKVLFVLGKPGVGKTTLIHHMAAELTGLGRRGVARWIRARWRDRPNAGPFWIRLRDFVSKPDIVAALDAELWQPPAPYIVLVDGLDEVPGAQRHIVASWIAKRAGETDARWIVTSRPEGFEKLHVACCHLEVQPLDMSRIGALVRAHFQGEPEKAESLLDQIRRRETYYRFARNPLLLRMMVDLHRSGESAETRVELYRKILLAVLDRRQREKGVSPAIPGEDLLTVLGKVAWEMGDRLEVPEEELRRLIGRHTQARVDEWVQAAFHFFPGDTRRREFAHRSFQEYLAATAVPGGSAGTLLGRLEAHAGDGSFWNETTRFHAALSPERFRDVFDRCQAKHTTLLIACGLDIPSGSEWDAERARFNGWLEARLNDPDGWREAAKARLAVRLRSMEPRGDDAVEDTSLITNAELQLFLETEGGKKYIPVHWRVPRFPTGSGSLPALGVSFGCADALSSWLSEGDPHFRYALPSSDSAMARTNPGSFWSEGVGEIACAPQPAAADAARTALVRLALDFSPVTVALDVANARAHACDLAHARTCDLALDRARTRALDIHLELARHKARNLNLDVDLAIDLDLALDRDYSLLRLGTMLLTFAAMNGECLQGRDLTVQSARLGLPRHLVLWFTERGRQHRMYLEHRRTNLERARNLYLDLFLQTLILDQRRKGNPLFAPFEGILLVKKRRVQKTEQ